MARAGEWRQWMLAAAGWLIASLALAAPGVERLPELSLLEPLPPESIPAPPPAGTPYFDLDAYQAAQPPIAGEYWSYQSLPDGLIYKSYLAGVKESRLSAHLISEQDDGWLWDSTLGGRVGIFRYGTRDPVAPRGFQLDVEGSAQLRLDIPEEVDVRSVNFKAGLWGTYSANGRGAWKFGYYHLSSHLGDEFLLDFPTYPRLNYARDTIVLGYSYYLRPRLRLYAEAGWAFYTDVAEPWEFQFGVDWAPTGPTGVRGAPFFAANGHLRQELDYGGTLSVQVGWAWRGDENSHLVRTGLHYLNGASPQYSFYAFHEQQIGYGLWYDY